MTLNVDLPKHFYAFVDARYLTDRQVEEWWPCAVFAAASQGGRALGFHVMLESGAVYWRVPVHALAWQRGVEPLPLGVLQKWDCFGDEVVCNVFDYLEELECEVRLETQDRCVKWSAERGTYVCTFDWLGNGYSEQPDQHKCLHLIRLDSGRFCLYPNNYILWHERSFTKPNTGQEKLLRVNRYVYRAEADQEEVLLP